ncbi:MAG: hypothetical protein ACREUE_03070 [Panacagrimonas sp.]
MGLQMGELILGSTVRAVQDVIDSRGFCCAVGTAGCIVHFQMDYRTMVVDMHIRPAEGPIIELQFDQEWIKAHPKVSVCFEATGWEDLNPRARIPPRPPQPAPPEVPLVARVLRKLVGLPARPAPSPTARHVSLDEHLEHIFKLARQGESEKANAYWIALDQAHAQTRERNWGAERSTAEDLGARAMQLVDRDGRISDPMAWAWLKERSIHHWHCWGSQATSGGEGTEMVRHINAAKKAFEQAEQVHARAGIP